METVGGHLPGLQVQSPHIVMHLLLLLLALLPGSMPTNDKEDCAMYGHLTTTSGCWSSRDSCTPTCPLMLFCIVLPYVIEVSVTAQIVSRCCCSCRKDILEPSSVFEASGGTSLEIADVLQTNTTSRVIETCMLCDVGSCRRAVMHSTYVRSVKAYLASPVPSS